MCSRVLLILLSSLVPSIYGFLQSDESLYLTNFPNIIAKSYSQPLPAGLLSSQCKQTTGFTNQTINLPSGAVNAATAQSLCGINSVCVVPATTTLTMDGSLIVGALLNYGTVTWTSTTQTASAQWLCAGYVVTDGGTFTLNIPDFTKQAIIYIRNNGAVHTTLRSRVFGGTHGATLTVTGSPMTRTWSLLSQPVSQGATSITLMHDANAMGWHVGDRIVIASTQFGSVGTSDVFNIGSISGNVINLASAFPTNRAGTSQSFTASQSIIETAWIAAETAEVMDMTRNVLITGDDFQHKACVAPMLLTMGVGYSTGMDPQQDCTCISPQQASYYRTTCTLGLHTIASGPGTTLNMQYTRVEKCGQRGILGKYCIHLHEIGYCPTCLIRGNSIEYAHHRGITVHGSHSATVLENVLSDVRGANIYVEDGNEMFNQIRHNVAICPWPLRDPIMSGCTIPGTDEDQADTELNQAGLWALSFTNDVVGNRFGNSYNGMLYQSQGFEHGRHETVNRECTVNQQLGRLEGNTFHGHGRFGTYLLASIYPKQLSRTMPMPSNGLVPAPVTDAYGINPVWASCAANNPDGSDRGSMYMIVRNVDVGNGFVGQYNLGDIQYREHTSIGNDQGLYWKEVKNPADGCSPMVINSYFYGIPYVGWSNIALPGGHGTIVLENVVMGGWITFESNHHCGVGVTGVLCMPQYVFVNPNTNAITAFQYIWQANNGAMWNLSPNDGMNPNGQMFPAGYISLANPYWTYLLAIDGGASCISSSDPSIITPMMSTYGGGILCKRPLRRLEVYTPALTASMNPPQLRLELWQNNQMISFVLVPFWQIDNGETGKNGYAMTVIPGLDHSYRLMRADLGPLSSDWVIEFSDPIFGNRWNLDQIYLQVTGRTCPSIVHSLHDRTFIWYDSDNHPFAPGHGACTTQPDMTPVNCAAATPPPNGMSCPQMCPGGCTNGYCDCGRGVCQCEAGFSGPTCSIDSCAASGCDPIGGRCSTRYLGGTLQPVDGACVCRAGAFGPKCSINPCSGQTCSGHGTCQAISQTSITCACADGWGGNSCSSSCPGAVHGYLMYANSALQANIYNRAPAASGTDCRDQCSADPKCVASSFYNSNYCAFMSSTSGMLLPTITNNLIQALAGTITLFVKCQVPNDPPLVASTGGFTSQPTGAPTTPPITQATTTPTTPPVTVTTSKPTLSSSSSSGSIGSPATSAPTTVTSTGPACVNGFITYTGQTYDLMGLPYTATTTAAACQALCAAQDANTCAAAVWYNFNACVRYTAAQAQGKTLSPSPDPTLPRTTFVRCTATATQPPVTQAPATQPPATQAPATQAPTVTTTTTAPTSQPSTSTSTGPACINGFQMYADTTWNLMGLPYTATTTAQACQALCAAQDPNTCAGAVWYNFNACVRFTQAQTVGQVMSKSPDPTLPRTLMVRCTATATQAPTTPSATQAPATQAPATKAPATQAPATQAPATQAPTTVPGQPACVAGFQTYTDSTYSNLGGLPYIITYTAAACLQACSAQSAATCAGATWYNYNACVLFNSQQVVGNAIVKSPDPTLPRTTFVRCSGAAMPSTPTLTVYTTCSSVICVLPTCSGNATRVLGMTANPIENICCDLYSCQMSMSSHGAASTINTGANMGVDTSASSDTTPSTSTSSQHVIIGATIGIGAFLITMVIMTYRYMKQTRSNKVTQSTPRIKVPTEDHDDDAHEKESHDKVPPMIPFSSPASEFNHSPSPISSLASPVLRALAGSPTQAPPPVTPLSSISLDSPSPHDRGSMSHRHPLRPSTSATSLLTIDPRVQVMNTRQMNFQQQEGEQQQRKP